jgi:predicted secreted protein
MKIRIFDGASSYVVICGLTARSFNRSAETVDYTVPDCDEPDKVLSVKRIKRTMSAELTGSGVYAMDDRIRMDAFHADKLSRIMRIQIDVPLASDGGYWQGSFHLTGLNITGNDEEGNITSEMTFLSDGAWAWTDAAA